MVLVGFDGVISGVDLMQLQWNSGSSFSDVISIDSLIGGSYLREEVRVEALP